MSEEASPGGPGEVEPPEGWGALATPGPSPNVQATMNQMTEQLQTVIDAAERAAAAIRFDAEEQARRHLAEAQRKADRLTAERVRLIADLTDDLVRHAETVRSRSEEMALSLEEAVRSVAEKLDEHALGDQVAPAATDEGAAPVIGENALLRATRMAVNGADPAEISRTLREEFGIAEPEPIVAQVVGRSPDA